MFASTLALALSAAPTWTFRVQTNLLRQPEAVAELPEAPDAPGHYLKFSCSVLTGPVFEAGLGARSFDDFARYSAGAAAENATIALTIAPDRGAVVSVTARPAAEQVTAHAFTVGGSEAVAAAMAVSNAGAISIAAQNVRSDFSTEGARSVIEQTLSACPFNG